MRIYRKFGIIHLKSGQKHKRIDTMPIDTCQELADDKLSGKKYLEVEKDVLGFKVGQHIIFYKKLKGNKIEIARILHSRMDLKSKIGK